MIRADGSGTRDLVTTPGHYSAPSFSPDGQWVTYRSAGGDNVRGPTHGENPGVFIIPVDGSEEPRRIRATGSNPLFDPTGSRILVNDFADGNRRLVSVDLDGRMKSFISNRKTPPRSSLHPMADGWPSQNATVPTSPPSHGLEERSR